jgi:hypothetical protein|tara:strand:- start:713 stop:925 length:213 start_codon:yes stop_codon:yes gene_type:complete
MKNKQLFLLFGIGAIFLTQIAYLIDSDPPYDDIKLTIMEFSIISLFFFGLFWAVYFIAKFAKRIISNSFK